MATNEFKIRQGLIIGNVATNGAIANVLVIDSDGKVYKRDDFTGGGGGTGATGAQGVQGAQGNQGNQGPTGPTSLDPYSGNIVPSTDVYYHIGTQDKRYQEIYAYDTYVGDVIFLNNWRITEFDENGNLCNCLRIVDQNGKTIKVIQ